MSEVSDKELEDYINRALIDQYIINAENKLLNLLKIRQENFPSERHDNQWLQISNSISERRAGKYD